jgi:hypothetical protein
MERSKRRAFGVLLARGPARFVALRLVLAVALLLALGSTSALAEAINVERRALAEPDDVDRATRGFKFGGAAGVFFRNPDDHVGFSLTGDLLWDFRLGPLILAPGARLTGYFASGSDGVGGFATLRAGFTLGPVVPFALGGAGFGFIARPNEWGFAYQGGGGLMVVFRRRLSLGLEASYQGFASTDFHATNLAGYMQISY